MKVLVDNELPPALARLLSELDLDCHHVQELGMDSWTDRQIWRHAVAEGFVLVSKDSDFVDLAKSSDDQVSVVWVRFGNCRTKELLASFRTLWPEITKRIEAGETVIELL
jgi:predicted nuclease of predicted toxin-antitoxin system